MPDGRRGHSASPAPTARSAVCCSTCFAALDDPVDRAALDVVWPDPVQRERALDTLVVDGLVDPQPDGRYRLTRPAVENMT